MAVEAITNTAAYMEKPVKQQKPEQTVEHTSRQEVAPITITEVAAVEKSAKSQRDGSKDGDERQEGQATQKQIRDAVSQANSKMKTVRTGCEFSYHEATKRVSIKVIDKDTKEVIREIPPEKSLKMVEKMWELAGILVDEKL